MRTQGDSLRALAARACTLSERIAGSIEVHPDGAHSERRLRRWGEVVARGDADRFTERLGLDGLDVERAAAVVGKANWAGPDPEWAMLVAAAINHAADADLDDDRCLAANGDRIPLHELMVTFVRAARTRLRSRIELPSSVLGPSVLPTLERQLLAELGSLASSCADVEFRLWRRHRLDPLEEAISRAGGNPGRDLYDGWVTELRASRLRPLLATYPVLARQLGTVALGWADATVEFLERLKADSRLLAETFTARQPLGPLVEVGGAASDPHRGRRRVVGCTFESGLRLVYKPKSLRTEVVYGSLLEFLNEHGADPALRVLRVLDRGEHGWVEMAEQAGVAAEEAARRFYRRTGMLLALMYAVGGKDCHAENFVAAGEDPVVVDAETVLHPILLPVDAIPGANLDAPHAAVDLYSASVLGVGLLPDWLIGPEGGALDYSALGAIEPQQGLQPFPRWEHPGTDVARMILETGSVDPRANVLRLDGRSQRPEDYLDDLCAGFTHAYGVMLRARERLLASDGPIAALEDAPVRVLFRGTVVYLRALNCAQQPGDLRDGADHSIELELLGRPLLDSPDPAAFWELHRGEQRQLEATDVPYFAAPGAAEALCEEDGRALVRFRVSAVETARQRLRALSGKDQRLQVGLLRAALGTRSATEPAATRVDHPLPSIARAGERDLASDPALEAAFLLGRELDTTAIRSGKSVAWVGLSLGDEGERWMLRPTAYDLYGGAVGIAVFLAALARVTGDRRWRGLALAALSPTLEQSERDPSRMIALLGIGGSAGCGGIIYALVLVAELLGEERPISAAGRLAAALPRAAFEQDRRLDLLAGSAGALVALLALDRVAGGNEQAVDLAAAAGTVLVAAAVEVDDGSVMWETLRGRTLDGFAHGTAGIALALARLAARVGDEGLATFVRRAVFGESSRFDSALGGWPDRRSDTERGAMNSWCHGSAGIGLARLGLLETSLRIELEATATSDLARAKTAVAITHPAGDHLCCGGAGEVEFLLELARLGADLDARRLAEARCDELAQRILAGESPRLTRPRTDAGGVVPSPGLFQGTSGVGLCLLRRVVPDLPSVLAWR